MSNARESRFSVNAIRERLKDVRYQPKPTKKRRKSSKMSQELDKYDLVVNEFSDAVTNRSVPREQDTIPNTEDDVDSENEGQYANQYNTKRDLPDLNALIDNKIKKFTDDSFIYLNYTVPKHSEYFTPYSLKQVKYKELKGKYMYFTMSRYGVTMWSPHENYFTELNQWQKEYQMYCKIINIKAFALFRMWKGFKVWQKGVKWTKWHEARNNLQENLIFANPELSHAALKLQNDLWNLRGNVFVNVKMIENWHPFYFIEVQMQYLEELRGILKSFHAVARDYIYHAMTKAIIAKGFSAIDEIYIYSSVKKMKDSMSFMDRAKKRRFCRLLSK